MDSCRSLIALLIVMILYPATRALRFDLQSGDMKCIAEDIPTRAMVVGKYSVVNPNEGHPLPPSHKINVKVMSAQETTYHQADGVETGQFAYSAGEGGDHVACFSAVDHSPEVTMTVDFDWRTGVHAKDWSNVAKKGQVDTMEFEVKRLLDTVSSIRDDMFYLRDREYEMQELNIGTNAKMAWLSFLSLVVCLSVAGLQLWHLKTFFEKKKVI
ncbi:PREDICTED: transmembrane emp24 domain-containing protein p24delta7-like [Tarenaya hassleriana]|uniref:transmembrane emp24 domain-containing protein p24delta7-like n=1 Tax=Tarenaya hassleriana TaxID=28532 RepID=UPI00053C3D2B|nr:PREDICTED: transmembrane emp24 domain-containing protein p24delta7-like [Tarenaya hassleriana]